MTTKLEFSHFMTGFNVHDIDDIPSALNFRDLVLGIQVEYPFQVARIISTPLGPTRYQDGLIGVIVPHIVEDDINAIMSRVSEKPLLSGSIDIGTGTILQNTPDTLLVNPESFVNSVLLASLYYYQRGDFETVGKMMGYAQEIMPYLSSAGSVWTLTQKDQSTGLAVVGNINNSEQLLDPYKHQEEIFPNTVIPGTKLS